MSQPELIVNQIIGISLVSTWINLTLFTFELMLVGHYIRHNHFSKDGFLVQCLLVALVILDTVGTLVSCANTWMFAIDHTMLLHHVWTLPVIVLTTAVVSTLEHIFMIHRIFMLSKGYALCGVFLLLVMIHVVFTIISAVYVARDPGLTLNFRNTVTTVSFSVEALINILISIAFVWYLQKYESRFSSTQSLIRRVSIYAFSSGFIAAAVGIVFLALFWVGSLAFITLPNLHGRIYSIAVVANLMIRRCRNEDSCESVTGPHPTILFRNNACMNTLEVLEMSFPHQEHMACNSGAAKTNIQHSTIHHTIR